METLSISSLQVNRSNRKVISELSFGAINNRIKVSGGNGSGKTTLLLAIAGLLPSSAGEVRLLGQARPAERRKICGVFSSGLSVPEYLSVAQATSLFNGDSREELARFEAQFLDGINPGARMISLSEGQKRKVATVCALRKERGALLLDEPFNALDTASVNLLRDYLQIYQGLLIYVDHRNSAAGHEEACLAL